MNRYFSTFITGFDTAIGDALKRTLKEAKIELLLDGLVVYSTNKSTEDIKRLGFFNNSFLLLKLFEKRNNQDINWMMRQVINNSNLSLSKAILPKRFRTFRVIASKENQFISVDRILLNKIESKIQHLTGLRTNRSLPDVEFWFLARSEGHGFFGMRLTRHQDLAKSLQKGELRPEFANILNLLSEPNKSDLFLDPFAGSGAIPIERSKQFPFARIIAGDNDQTIVNNLKERVKGKNSRLDIRRLDALLLSDLKDSSVDKIVTDPPWGHFLNIDLDLKDFYGQMLDSFYRVLKNNGLAIVLVGDRELFEDVLNTFSHRFLLVGKYYTLVSGRKAGVYKITKHIPRK